MTTKLAQSGLQIALLLFLTPVALAQPSLKFQSSNPVVLKDTRFEPVSIKVRLLSDDAIMKLSGAGYRVFVKKFGAGEIEFGPACAHVRLNTMYFACFAKAAALR